MDEAVGIEGIDPATHWAVVAHATKQEFMLARYDRINFGRLHAKKHWVVATISEASNGRTPDQEDLENVLLHFNLMP